MNNIITQLKKPLLNNNSHHILLHTIISNPKKTPFVFRVRVFTGSLFFSIATFMVIISTHSSSKIIADTTKVTQCTSEKECKKAINLFVKNAGTLITQTKKINADISSFQNLHKSILAVSLFMRTHINISKDKELFDRVKTLTRISESGLSDKETESRVLAFVNNE